MRAGVYSICTLIFQRRHSRHERGWSPASTGLSVHEDGGRVSTRPRLKLCRMRKDSNPRDWTGSKTRTAEARRVRSYEVPKIIEY